MLEIPQLIASGEIDQALERIATAQFISGIEFNYVYDAMLRENDDGKIADYVEALREMHGKLEPIVQQQVLDNFKLKLVIDIDVPNRDAFLEGEEGDIEYRDVMEKARDACFGMLASNHDILKHQQDIERGDILTETETEVEVAVNAATIDTEQIQGEQSAAVLQEKESGEHAATDNKKEPQEKEPGKKDKEADKGKDKKNDPMFIKKAEQFVDYVDKNWLPTTFKGALRSGFLMYIIFPQAAITFLLAGAVMSAVSGIGNVIKDIVTPKGEITDKEKEKIAKEAVEKYKEQQEGLNKEKDTAISTKGNEPATQQNAGIQNTPQTVDDPAKTAVPTTAVSQEQSANKPESSVVGVVSKEGIQQQGTVGIGADADELRHIVQEMQDSGIKTGIQTTTSETKVDVPEKVEQGKGGGGRGM